MMCLISIFIALDSPKFYKFNGQFNEFSQIFFNLNDVNFLILIYSIFCSSSHTALLILYNIFIGNITSISITATLNYYQPTALIYCLPC